MKNILKTMMLSTLILAFLLSFAGCNKKTENGGANGQAGTISVDDLNGAKAVVGNLLEAFKSGNEDEVGKYVYDGSKSVVDVEGLKDGDMVLSAVFSSIEYETGAVSVVNDTTSTVKTKITTLDLGGILNECTMKVMQEVVTGVIGEDQIDARVEEVFKETISGEGLPKKTLEIDVAVRKTDSGWKVVIDDAFQNAVSGGFLGAVNDAQNAMGSAVQ